MTDKLHEQQNVIWQHLVILFSLSFREIYKLLKEARNISSSLDFYKLFHT